jgi:DNA topoisomerase-1
MANIANSLVDPKRLARLARLRYVSDSDPGFGRERNGHGFKYLNSRGSRLRSESQVTRIEHLAIPPAWKGVWICRFTNGHLQATGLDSRKRKQYLYHERWRSVADSAKFLRLADFGELMPKLRRDVSRRLQGEELTRERVLAGMVAVLDATSIRIGNEEYVRANNSFGLSTLRTRHVTSKNGSVELRFRAKGGFHREVVIHEKRLVRLLRQLRRLRGAHVFQYRDDTGDIRDVDAMEVNDFLRELSGHEITAKDFRTWKASALAAGHLYDDRDVEPLAARKEVIKRVVAEVAELLANTPAVCRKSYIHPGLFAAYEAGAFPKLFRRFTPRTARGFSREEQIFASFLRRWDPADFAE